MLENEAGAAFVLAGGTDLLVRMKLGHIEPALVVDIKRIPAMSAITHSSQWHPHRRCRIGRTAG